MDSIIHNLIPFKPVQSNLIYYILIQVMVALLRGWVAHIISFFSHFKSNLKLNIISVIDAVVHTKQKCLQLLRYPINYLH